MMQNLYLSYKLQCNFTFLCSSNSWSASSFSFLNCSSKTKSLFSISALRSIPCFSKSSTCAKFQSTVSPFAGVSAGDAFSIISGAAKFQMNS